MIDLQDSCCLDISFDDENNALHYGEGVYPGDTNRIPLSNLHPILLNKALSYPEHVYEEHKSVFHEEDRNIANTGVSFDIITLPAGLLGIEFIKTHIYYSPDTKTQGQYSCVVEVHYGELTVILQKNKPKDALDFDTYVDEGYVATLKKGDKLAIQTGFFHTFINADTVPVVFTRVYKENGILDYKNLQRENGLGYYCIRKNAKMEIVHNPMYKEVPAIKTINLKANQQAFGLKQPESLYSQLRTNCEIFEKQLWG